MLDKSNWLREYSEPQSEYIVRSARAARIKKMIEVRDALSSVRCTGLPYDENLYNALEALTEIVDDIIEEGFV